MNNYVLSICIASYNKAELTVALVQSILRNNNPKLGVVVVDNASTDNTIDLLKAIEDSRLKVIKNDHNIGGAANMVRAVYNGSGYCLYCNDRDLIYPEKLDDFINFLEKHPNYSCGWVCRRTPKVQETFTEFETIEAFKKMCWRCEHPTGFFFNSCFLSKYDEQSWNKYVNPVGWIAFPHESMQAELVTNGKYVRYNIPVWRSTGNESHKNYVSGYDNVKTEGERWFYPENCINRGSAHLAQFWEICKKNNIQMDEKTRYEVYANIILGEQKIGVWRYQQIFASKTLSYHYAVKPRKVSTKELKKINNQIINSLVSVIRNEEKKTSRYERVIFDLIKTSDKSTRRILLISKYLGKILRLRFVRKIRGKL